MIPDLEVQKKKGEQDFTIVTRETNKVREMQQ